MIVEINCLGTGYKNYNQAYIKIYNKCNKLIRSQKTFNGRVSIFLNKDEYYKIYSSLNNTTKFVYFKVNNNKLNISFYNNYISYNHNITLYLTDYYYNMPIEKGFITLWQKQ